MINGYDFPEISYFEQGNIYTGCKGDEFRYRIAPEDKKLKASVWYEDLCYEKCHIDSEEFFEMTNEDLVKAIEWIFSKQK